MLSLEEAVILKGYEESATLNREQILDYIRLLKKVEIKVVNEKPKKKVK